jgi:type IV secretory pathway VirB9-like protein
MMRRIVLAIPVAAMVAWAQRPAKQEIRFDEPRTVQASESKKVPVYLCDMQGVEVTLPKGELLRMSTVGDSKNWDVKAVEEDRRDISIRPIEPLTSQTILNVTSDHENHYVFLLLMNEGHCDSHVTLEAGHDLQQRIERTHPWATPEAYQAALQAAAEARQAAANAVEQSSQKVQSTSNEEDKFRSKLVGNEVFDYEWDAKEGEKMGIQSIFHDDRFTYIKIKTQEPPVLCEMKGGQLSAIQYSFADGTYETSRIMDAGYLVKGGTGNGKHQEKFHFERKKASTESKGGV